MTNLYNFITRTIMPITNKVFPKKAPNDTQYPYVVFAFPTQNVLENADQVFLEVDVWDSRKSEYDVITEIETLTDSINNALKKVRYLDENMFLMFQNINRLDVPDIDSNIERRQLRYLIKKYSR